MHADAGRHGSHRLDPAIRKRHQLVNGVMAALAVVAATCTGAVVAHPFDLDPTFGSQGVVRLGSESPPIGVPNGGTAGPLAMQPDRRIVLVVNGQGLEAVGIWRLQEDGSPDATFANAARLGTDFFANQVVLQPDGKIVASGGNGWTALRLLPDGTNDNAFGFLGGAVANIAPAGLGVQNDGRIVVGGNLFDNLALARFLPDGQPDIDFGPQGIRNSPLFAHAAAFTLLPDGASLIVAADDASPAGALVAKFRRTGTLEPAFGLDGVFHDTSSNALTPRGVAVQADGRIVIVGQAWDDDGVPHLAAMRLDVFGNVDPSFGSSGRFTLPAEAGGSSEARAVAIDSRQRIVIVGTLGDLSESSAGFRRIAVVRLTQDGSPDATFAPHGMTTVWDGYSSAARGVAIDASDRIVVSGSREAAPTFVTAFPTFLVYRRNPRPAVFRLQGGDGAVAFTLDLGLAIEYYHAQFAQYFVTADPSEIAYVDTFLGPAWVRTGKSFRVWTEADPALRPTCRFFSGETFAPISAHFYTPYPDECDALRKGTVWAYEGNAFELQLPLATPPAFAPCPAGTQPLYRAYNNGQGGAPGHRYMDDPALLDAMIAQGWSFEGDASTRVFACVPI